MEKRPPQERAKFVLRHLRNKTKRKERIESTTSGMTIYLKVVRTDYGTEYLPWEGFKQRSRLLRLLLTPYWQMNQSRETSSVDQPFT